MLILGVLLLNACAARGNQEQQQQQPYLGNHESQSNVAGSDLYNANKNVQKPQAGAWGWMSNQY
jgi:hypothetical protein